MKIADFNRPVYGFISSGKFDMMYTLRIMYHGVEIVNREQFPCTISHYARNLSTDFEKARIKASELLSEWSIPFNDMESFELLGGDITRESTEARAERIESEREAKELKAAIEFNDAVETIFAVGRISSGKYVGLTIDELANADMPYMRWLYKTLMNKAHKDSKDVATIRLIDAWSVENEFDSAFIGVVGEKIEVDLKFISTHGYASLFVRGAMSYVHRFMDADRNEVTITSSAKAMMKLEHGKTYKIAATVKKHDYYSGINKTVLSRPKIM